MLVGFWKIAIALTLICTVFETQTRARYTNSTPSIFFAGFELLFQLQYKQTNGMNVYGKKTLSFHSLNWTVPLHFMLAKIPNPAQIKWFEISCFAIDVGLVVLCSFLQRTLNFRLHIPLCTHISQNLINSHQMFSFISPGNKQTYRGLIAINCKIQSVRRHQHQIVEVKESFPEITNPSEWMQWPVF